MDINDNPNGSTHMALPQILSLMDWFNNFSMQTVNHVSREAVDHIPPSALGTLCRENSLDPTEEDTYKPAGRSYYQDALRPDPGTEADFRVEKSEFAFTRPIGKVVDPKSLGAIYETFEFYSKQKNQNSIQGEEIATELDLNTYNLSGLQRWCAEINGQHKAKCHPKPASFVDRIVILNNQTPPFNEAVVTEAGDYFNRLLLAAAIGTVGGNLGRNLMSPLVLSLLAIILLAMRSTYTTRKRSRKLDKAFGSRVQYAMLFIVSIQETAKKAVRYNKVFWLFEKPRILSLSYIPTDGLLAKPLAGYMVSTILKPLARDRPNARQLLLILTASSQIPKAAAENVEVFTKTSWKQRALTAMCDIAVTCAFLVAPTVIIIIAGSIAVYLRQTRREGASIFAMLGMALLFTTIREPGQRDLGEDRFVLLAVGLSYIIYMCVYCQLIAIRLEGDKGFCSLLIGFGIVMTIIAMALAPVREYWSALTGLDPFFALFLAIPLSFLLCDVVTHAVDRPQGRPEPLLPEPVPGPRVPSSSKALQDTYLDHLRAKDKHIARRQALNIRKDQR